jgi:hypothetical protein
MVNTHTECGLIVVHKQFFGTVTARYISCVNPPIAYPDWRALPGRFQLGD